MCTFFKSVGENIITLSGLLAWEGEIDVDYELRLIVRNGSNVKYDILLASYTGNGSTQSYEYYLFERLNLVHKDEVSLVLVGLDESNHIEIRYSEETYINITRDTEDEGVVNSECYGLFIEEAIQQLLDKITDGEVQLKQDVFKGDFITNGNNIRGIRSDINISLAELISNVIPIFDLECDLIDSNFHIRKADVAVNELAIRFDGGVEAVVDADLNRLHSSVKVGYPNWQSERKLKGAEFNSIRTYSTESNYGSTELGLTSGIITSGYIIEEQRRILFDEDKRGNGSKYDESIFMIALQGNIVEQLDMYQPVGGLIVADGVYNLKYNPYQILKNNKRQLKYLGELKLESSEGNVSLIVNGERTAQNLNFGDEMPYITDIEMIADPRLFDDMRYLDVDINGQSTLVRVLNATMGVSNGKTMVNLTGEIC